MFISQVFYHEISFLLGCLHAFDDTLRQLNLLHWWQVMSSPNLFDSSLNHFESLSDLWLVLLLGVVSCITFARDPLVKCAQVLKHVLGLLLVSHLLLLRAASYIFNLLHILFECLKSLLSVSLCARFLHFLKFLRFRFKLTQLLAQELAFMLAFLVLELV